MNSSKKKIKKIYDNLVAIKKCHSLFYDGRLYHIETSPLICATNQWTIFYMMVTSIMKKLKKSLLNKGIVEQKMLLKKTPVEVKTK